LRVTVPVTIRLAKQVVFCDNLIDFYQGHVDKRAGHKVAIVVTNDLSFGLSRMYEFQAAKLKANIEVFRDFEQARQ